MSVGRDKRLQLAFLTLRGFKTIKRLDSFELRARNILIGANGAGKSNFISFFKMLGWITPPPGNLQFFVARSGGAHSLLFDGPAVTPQLEAHLTFNTLKGINEYYFRLFYAARDTLIFADERYRFIPKSILTEAVWSEVGSGHSEAGLIEHAAQHGRTTARTILGLLKQCVVYQFHNTSETARIRQKWAVDDNRHLKEDAANLAPFLLRLSTTKAQYYQRIVEAVRQVAPFFADFVLEPTEGTVMLQWRERNSDLVFGPHQASDGTLRVMALIALLLQPTDDLPAVLILDEPELGLHPFAIGVVAGLIKSASSHSQVILATQSTTLIDYFDLEDLVVVERSNGESVFRRLDPLLLKEWLDEYSLAELWEKNVLGGRPA